MNPEEQKIILFNTLSGKPEEFEPLEKGKLRLYTCGPTVYNYAHIGNFRTFVVEDLLRRFFEFRGFLVKHVMNITDVDDKTIAGAVAEKIPLDEFTQKYTDAFFEDVRALNILEPNHPESPPRATREIPSMLEMIGRLVERGTAYEKDGSIYFRIAEFPDYGKLSKKKLEKNRAGARVDVDEYDKEAASDFVLWKRAREGEPSWDSPWGPGRPGWHIECSAMSLKYLGNTFDIHAGGEDLIFPHHENEIAQSEGVTEKPFVRYWLHVRFLLVDGQKMSKSKGNFYTLRDLMEKGYDPRVIRYELLATHYRTSLNFTLKGLEAAAESLSKLLDCYYQCLSLSAHEQRSDDDLKGESLEPALTKTLEDMMAELSGDLNISAALSRLWETIRLINSRESELGLRSLRAVLRFFKRIDKLLGLGIAGEDSLPDAVKEKLRERHEIRSCPDFKKDPAMLEQSDRLRDELDKMGWQVKDTRPGDPGLSTVRKKASLLPGKEK